jgi:orsellinic acid C2-O-methyltransferase
MATSPGATPAPPPPQQQILAAVLGLFQSRPIAAPADLGLADLLAERPLHVDSLAERTRTHSPSLFRLIRALEIAGIFTQVSPAGLREYPV